MTCPYSYKLRYIDKESERDTSIYAPFGSAIHEALEDYYEGKIGFEQIAERFEVSVFELLNIAEKKFNNSDEEKNEAIETKYLACLRHFAKNHKRMADKVANEKFVLTKLVKGDQDEYFMGYIDAVHKEKDGTVIITDYKTSTKYSGEKIRENGSQLVLNSIGISQMFRVPITSIKARWNFLKYLTIKYKLKNKKDKETIAERHKWVAALETNLRMKLKDAGYNELESETLVLRAISENTLDCIPEEIRNTYTFDDAYVYVDLSPFAINNTVDMLFENINEIRSHEVNPTEDSFNKEVTDKDSYFCSQLCGYSHMCPHYKKYIDDRAMFLNENLSSTNNTEKTETDLSWLNDL